MAKNWLFGNKRKDDAQAISVLKAQMNRYQHETRNLERQADEQKVLAAKMLQSNNKSGARAALQRRQIYLKKINQAQNMIMNLQTQLDSIQTATSTVETVKAMETGTKVVGSKLKEVSPEKAEAVMDSVMEQRDQLDMMTEALSDTSLSDSMLDLGDSEIIDDELDQLQAELDLGKTTSLPNLEGLTEPPSEKPRVKKGEKEEEDTSDIEAELEALKKEFSQEK